MVIIWIEIFFVVLIKMNFIIIVKTKSTKMYKILYFVCLIKKKSKRKRMFANHWMRIDCFFHFSLLIVRQMSPTHIFLEIFVYIGTQSCMVVIQIIIITAKKKQMIIKKKIIAKKEWIEYWKYNKKMMIQKKIIMTIIFINVCFVLSQQHYIIQNLIKKLLIIYIKEHILSS